jgi:hypothetical protein
MWIVSREIVMPFHPLHTRTGSHAQLSNTSAIDAGNVVVDFASVATHARAHTPAHRAVGAAEWLFQAELFLLVLRRRDLRTAQKIGNDCEDVTARRLTAGRLTPSDRDCDTWAPIPSHITVARCVRVRVRVCVRACGCARARDMCVCDTALPAPSFRSYCRLLEDRADPRAGRDGVLQHLVVCPVATQRSTMQRGTKAPSVRPACLCWRVAASSIYCACNLVEDVTTLPGQPRVHAHAYAGVRRGRPSI